MSSFTSTSGAPAGAIVAPGASGAALPITSTTTTTTTFHQPEMSTRAYQAADVHHRYHIKVSEGASTMPLTSSSAAAMPAPITQSLPIHSTHQPLTTTGAPITQSIGQQQPLGDGRGTRQQSIAQPTLTHQPHMSTGAPITQSINQQPLMTGAAPITQSLPMHSTHQPLMTTGAPITQSIAQPTLTHQQPLLAGAAPITQSIAQPSTLGHEHQHAKLPINQSIAQPSSLTHQQPLLAPAPLAASSGLHHKEMELHNKEHNLLGHNMVNRLPATTTTTTTTTPALAPAALPVAPTATSVAPATAAATAAASAAAAAAASAAMAASINPSLATGTMTPGLTQPAMATTTTTHSGRAPLVGPDGRVLQHRHSGGMFCHNKAAAVSTAGMTKEEKKHHKAMLKEERKQEKLALKEQKKREKLARAEQKRLAKEQRTHHETAKTTRSTAYLSEKDRTTERLKTDMIKWDTLHGQSAPIGRYNEWNEDTLPFTPENLGLFIAVARGMNLTEVKEAKVDAYVKVLLIARGADGREIIHATHKSQTIKNTANPQWLFHVDDTPHLLGSTAATHDHNSNNWLREGGSLRVEVWDHDTLSRDDLLGWLEWPLAQLDNQVVRGDFQLNLPSAYKGVRSPVDTSRKSKVIQQAGTVFLEIRYRSPFATAGMRRGSGNMLATGMTTGAPLMTTGAPMMTTTPLVAIPVLEKRDTIYQPQAPLPLASSTMMPTTTTTASYPAATTYASLPPTYSYAMAPTTYTTAPTTYTTAPTTYATAPISSTLQPEHGRIGSGNHLGRSSLLDLSNAQHAVPMPAMVHSFPSHGSPKFFYKEKEAKETMPSYVHPASINMATKEDDSSKLALHRADAAFTKQPLSSQQPQPQQEWFGLPQQQKKVDAFAQPDTTQPDYILPSILAQQPLTQQLMATSGSASLLKEEQLRQSQSHQAHHLPTSAATISGSKPGELFATSAQPQSMTPEFI